MIGCTGTAFTKVLRARPPVTANPETPTPKTDEQIVAGFIVGYWPGLEDGINWSKPNNSPVLAAARRILAKQKEATSDR
jgi:hypothetical protein